MLPTIDSLSEIFSDDDKCQVYLKGKGAFYQTMICESCGGRMRQIGARMVLRCTGCRKEVCSRVHTFFYGSNLKCRDILRMGYFWLSKATHKQISMYTGHARQTVSDFMGHFRQLVSSSLEEEDTIIGGEGVTVEIDESKLSKRKYNVGHRVSGPWVVGGVERTEQRRVFLVPVEDRSRVTLERIIRSHVAPGSIINTDLWKGYGFLDKDESYEHGTVNHSKNFKNPETGVHTNTIEGTWSGLKQCIEKRYRTKIGVDHHLIEFIWRRKHHDNLWEAFLMAIRDIRYELS